MNASYYQDGIRSGRSMVGSRIGRGLLVLLPIGITFAVVQFAFDTLDGQLQPVIEQIFGREIRGLSFLVILVAAFLIGAFGPLAIIRYPGRIFESGIQGLPIAGGIYRASKQIADAMGGSDGPTGFNTVVRIEYPRQGLWTIGFLTKTVELDEGEKMGGVYMPSTPFPNTGWLVLLPLEEIQVLDMSTQEAMQYILTGGIVGPEKLTSHPVLESDLELVKELKPRIVK